MTIIDIARLFRFVREAGPNTGQRVEAIQRWCGGKPGESWCCYFVTMMLDLFFQGSSPIPRGGVVQDVLNLAREKGWIVPLGLVEEGDLVVSITPEGHGHHIAFATSIHPLTDIAGNTSEDGTSSNGTGVFEHPVSATGKVFIHYPRAA